MKLTKIRTIRYYDHFVREDLYHCAKCINPTLDRVYVRILATCMNYASVREIYPGKKNIMPEQLYMLETGGFLERFTKPEWVNYKKWPKTWWRTTRKGAEVVAKAVLAK